MFLTLVATLAVVASDPAGAPRRPPVAPPGMVIAASPAVPAGTPMREVCRRERAPGSNLTSRVCRQVPANSSARDRSASDRVRESQGSRTPQNF